MSRRLLAAVVGATALVLLATLAQLAVRNRAQGGCEMSYSYVSYVPVQLTSAPGASAAARGGRYQLFLYREGGKAQQRA